MPSRTIEYWLALAAAALYVFQRSSDKPLLNRLTLTAISAALGYSTAAEAATATGWPEIMVLILITSVGYLVLDFISALVADRRAFIDALRQFLGKK